MHNFTLALIGSINTFIFHLSPSPKYDIYHYASEQMDPTAKHFTRAWGLRVLRSQISQYFGCRLLSTLFDDNGGAVPTHKILSSCDLCPPQGLLDMVAGPGGRKLRGRLPLEKSLFLGAAGFRLQDTRIGSPLFSLLHFAGYRCSGHATPENWRIGFSSVK